MHLRDYQTQCLESISKALDRGIKRQLICLPTGAGKTAIFCHLPVMLTRKTLIVVPRIDLLKQTKEKYDSFNDHAATIFHGNKQSCGVVTITTIQTAMQNSAFLRDKEFRCVVIDEAHFSVSKSYRDFLHIIGALDTHSDILLLGFTATALRKDKIPLDRIFQETVFCRSLSEMIRWGILCPIKGYVINTNCGTKKALTLEAKSSILNNTNSCEVFYDQNKLGDVLNTQKRNEVILSVFKNYASSCKKTIVFCASLQHAMDLSELFNSNGIKSSFVHSYISISEREERIRQFEEGDTQALFNKDLLAQGYDFPAIDCVMICRPIESDLLYTQMVGRGTRLSPYKNELTLIDFRDKNSPYLCDAYSVSELEAHSKRAERWRKAMSSQTVVAYRFCSDGSLEVYCDDSKKNIEWSSTLASSAEIRKCKELYSNSIEIEEGITRKELQPIIDEAPATDQQRLILLSHGLWWKNMKYGEARKKLERLPAQTKDIEATKICPGSSNLRATQAKISRPLKATQRALLAKYNVHPPDDMTEKEASQLLRMIQERTSSQKLQGPTHE